MVMCTYKKKKTNPKTPEKIRWVVTESKLKNKRIFIIHIKSWRK